MTATYFDLEDIINNLLDEGESIEEIRMKVESYYQEWLEENDAGE